MWEIHVTGTEKNIPDVDEIEQIITQKLGNVTRGEGILKHDLSLTWKIDIISQALLRTSVGTTPVCI